MTNELLQKSLVQNRLSAVLTFILRLCWSWPRRHILILTTEWRCCSYRSHFLELPSLCFCCSEQFWWQIQIIWMYKSESTLPETVQSSDSIVWDWKAIWRNRLRLMFTGQTGAVQLTVNYHSGHREKGRWIKGWMCELGPWCYHVLIWNCPTGKCVRMTVHGSSVICAPSTSPYSVCPHTFLSESPSPFKTHTCMHTHTSIKDFSLFFIYWVLCFAQTSPHLWVDLIHLFTWRELLEGSRTPT